MKPSLTVDSVLAGFAFAVTLATAATLAKMRTRAVPAANRFFDMFVLSWTECGSRRGWQFVVRPRAARSAVAGGAGNREMGLGLATTSHDQRDDLRVRLRTRDHLADLACRAA